ncbi:hypothetical protein LTR78_005882 [Recurvomyces mirabilis]|uniref:Phosducin domain-containing protein n=1 Tax=Recurvomyces mirabilis TaxID=574656 RepID=A0AAE0WMH9_9PEZI|nr:hypothetical protein LTR78_005882 [Recurvomyces mirabilis]KAK5154263.1 Proteolipid protein 2 [Recurvomyces mirabilis]
MNMPDMPINVQVDPNEDTEWNDILRKHGVIPEKPPSPTPMIEEALEQARHLAQENRLEGKDLDELDELEDEEDEAFLDSYRQKRLGELQTIQTSSVYNQVYQIQKPEYSKEVTEESTKTTVLVLLTSSAGTNQASALMIPIWRELAKKWGDIKFCQMQGDLCIEGYPDRNTPTILIYKEGEIRRQIVTLQELKGMDTSLQDLEELLVGVGAVKLGDVRLRKKDEEEGEERRKAMWQGERNGGAKKGTDDGEDSDWE